MNSRAPSTSTSTLDHGRDMVSNVAGFLGLFSLIAYILLLFFDTSLLAMPLGDVNVPCLVVIALTCALLLPLFRLKRGFFESKQHAKILVIIGVCCTCLAPIGLLLADWWVPCAVFIGCGLCILAFMWTLYMCRFSHAALAMLLAFAVILAAVLFGTLLMSSPPPYLFFALRARPHLMAGDLEHQGLIRSRVLAYLL